ncbi:glycoside hydrolase family 9 protein, partial [Salinactinospora qingdaonensis]|uniref:glycoside hydrolase family 9 protein n=1 Tax=Salinactinospora qingdaonensis TaxID=702744 RepID=UPI0031E9E67A
ATLNLAATGAQCARIFEPYDAAFAADCLDAAETAWQAAQANPEVYAPTTGEGGGAYSDDEVSDEFYWAAAELFITTGEQSYADAVTSSPLHTEDVFTPGGFSWQSVAALGRLNLATVPNDLSDRDRVRDSVVTGADGYLDALGSSPWDLPYDPEDGVFVWGSNSQVLNNMVVMATAFDLTGEAQYRDGVLRGMDYILGRNALNQSYVTGYGENDAKNQHSRWYANQLDSSLPNPPDGTVAGGPNSNTSSWDPVAQDNLSGCAPQFCYIDDIESWATNELTVNWNAPLAWISSFIADQTGQQQSEDTTAPTVPGEPSASDVTSTEATLSWGASTDSGGSGLAGYEVYRETSSGDELVASPSGTSTTLSGLEPETEYTYHVVARDLAGNTSEASASVSFTTGAPPVDTTPPTVPGEPSASDVTTSAATLSWGASTDSGGSGLAGYEVYEQTSSGDELVASPSGTSTTLSGLEPATEYTYYVVARDLAGNTSEASATVTFTTDEETTGGVCAVDYSVANEWNSGFTGSVTVTNTGDTAIQDWELAFDFTAGQQLTNGWSAQWSQSGTTVTATAPSWASGDLAPGASVTAGFNASHSGDNPVPEEFTVNGTACD